MRLRHERDSLVVVEDIRNATDQRFFERNFIAGWF